MRHGRFVLVCLLTMLAAAAPRASAQTALSGAPITITRASGRITIDGDLSDEGWRHATRVTKWYETNPGDNSEPAVGNAGYLTYDDEYFYAGFEFADPDPRSIRAPYADRDNVPPYTDYGGVILDTRNDGKTAVLLVANPHGIQYDSISDDASGEDSSPDFFWESATRVTDRGWTLEMRIPFSSLRYRNVDPQTWGIMLYRNYPRAFRYQFFSAVLPRGGNCFICRANTLHGLEHLPSGGHIVAAPYVSAGDTAHPGGDLGTALRRDPITSQAGIDVKWTPTADNAVDLTVKPDFSQVESDTAQISANERFALFFPEKRPFFLEGVNLFSTPIQAIYTRTITAPRWGARMTGKEAGVGYTVLVADDAGGGSAIIPGPNDSTLVSEDFGATVFVARLKKDVGPSFVSMVLTDREGHDGNGRNLVAGPDVQWRPTDSDSVTGQWLISRTTTPNHPDVAAEWTGQRLASRAGTIQWAHNTTHYDAFGMYRDVGAGFRAETGFVPQVDDRDVNGSTGWTFRPTGLVSRLRMFVNLDRQADHAGVLISRNVEPGLRMDTRWNGFMQFRYIDDRIRAGDRAIGRRQFGYNVQISPSRRISQISLDGTLGEQIDFANARAGHGSTVNLSASLHPTSHLEFAVVENQEWLNVDDPAGTRQRLFVARVSRVKSTYTFNARSFARLIGQYVSTDRDAALFVSPVARRDGTFSGSALFAYKLNWQSVMFVGYGDDREVSDQNRLEPADRQFFVKLSYAFQR